MQYKYIVAGLYSVSFSLMIILSHVGRSICLARIFPKSREFPKLLSRSLGKRAFRIVLLTNAKSHSVVPLSPVHSGASVDSSATIVDIFTTITTTTIFFNIES